ncbi:(2Fe-2S)-binding protein [Paenibacillus sp. FJAT-27812]|uniref:(2Fe-2S)-binding protein n=1 Tax=Paenibacillus sp. FJAT-27812 TaxID=1684143 RepID=UPI0006A7EEF3|nr:(2Fe-2S)-binding protein [Paenibacillus sp. FJAT-27812]
MNDEMLTLLESSFNLTVNKPEELVFSCLASELLDENKMKSLLELYTPMIKGTEPSVGEVYMAGWFRGPMLGLIYTLSAWNKVPDLSLDNLSAQIYKAYYNEEQYYEVSFLMHNADLIAAPEQTDDSTEWATEKLMIFFEHTVRPVFETIAKAGTLNAGMLWSQLPTSLAYYHERLMNGEDSEHVKQAAERIFGIVKSLEGAVFGRSKNPLDVKFRMTESLGDPDKQVRLKSACCLYYLVEDGNYCFTCPKIKEDVRIEKRAAYRSKQQA